MSTVVVVGGGYGGTMVAKALDGEADVVLVDPRDAFVNVSASLRAAVRADWADRPFFSYDDLLEHGRVIRGRVVSADPSGVVLADGERVAADYLVLATGSTHTYPARPRSLATSAAEAAADLRATGGQIERATHVLVLGAGPVGLELAGEIRDAYPDKPIVVVDRSNEVLPGYLPEVRAELHRQLDEFGIELRLGTALQRLPAVAGGTEAAFSVMTTDGEELTADIWFRCFGTRANTEFLGDGALGRLTEFGTVLVDDHLNVLGHPNVYALGDIAELPDAKVATWAQTQAPTVIENLRAQLRGERAVTSYAPGSVPRILLPLGADHGVGQLPSPDGGAIVAPVETVIERKGADLFTTRFAERFHCS